MHRKFRFAAVFAMLLAAGCSSAAPDDEEATDQQMSNFGLGFSFIYYYLHANADGRLDMLIDHINPDLSSKCSNYDPYIDVTQDFTRVLSLSTPDSYQGIYNVAGVDGQYCGWHIEHSSGFLPDIDGDGLADIHFYNMNDPGQHAYFLSNGDGTFRQL